MPELNFLFDSLNGAPRTRRRKRVAEGFVFPNGGPGNVPGLVAWWDASYGVHWLVDGEDGRLVSWTDRAGRVASQGNTGRVPVYGSTINEYPAISFTKDLLDHQPAPVLDEFTALIVFRQNAPNGSNSGLMKVGDANLLVGMTNNVRWGGAGAQSPTHYITDGETYIAAGSIGVSGVTNLFRINDASYDWTSTWDGVQSDLWRIGATSNYANDTDIAQVCIWNRQLDPAELDQVLADFGAKYGVATA